jgi:hypothetical protein
MVTFKEWWYKNFGNLPKDPEVVAMKAYQYATERAAKIAETFPYHDESSGKWIAIKIRETE